MPPSSTERLPEALSAIHNVHGGEVHLLVTPQRDGGWMGRMWSAAGTRAAVFPTQQKAEAAVLGWFAKHAGPHACDERCRQPGPPRERAVVAQARIEQPVG